MAPTRRPPDRKPESGRRDRGHQTTTTHPMTNAEHNPWMQIESAPTTDHGYFFARIAWGPDNDKLTGDGMRYKGEWFTVGVYYNNANHDKRQYEFREQKVAPTHWKHHESFKSPQ